MNFISSNSFPIPDLPISLNKIIIKELISISSSYIFSIFSWNKILKEICNWSGFNIKNKECDLYNNDKYKKDNNSFNVVSSL